MDDSISNGDEGLLEADALEDRDNTFKILLSTDNHLGFAEKDAIRGDDSFIAFEEMLKKAVEHEVDFILLCGDLFHDGKPTVNTLNRCMSLLRLYCMGERPIPVEFLSDPADNFQHSAKPEVNYMDPNLNIAYPVFSIHGNHDDPLGYNGKCSLDMLSAAGLVNYFGRQMDLNNVVVSPLLMKKGYTKLAIYGLGALKEKMVHRLFRNNQVSMLCTDTHADDWFNIFMVHQNRIKHNTKGDEYLPESFLPSFADLVVWGHEHECLIRPEFSQLRKLYITQPGSSVATSLSQGESVRKQIGLLEVRGKQFRITGLPLDTVRPFVFRDVDVADFDLEDCVKKDIQVQQKLERVVEEMLTEARTQLSGNPNQPKEPLIRVRVKCHSSDEMFNLVRFGLQFQGTVANPGDMIMWQRPKNARVTGLKDDEIFDEDAMENANANLDLHTVPEFVEKYFEEADMSKQLKVLSVRGLNDSVEAFLKQGDLQAIDDLIEYQSEKTQKYLLELDVDEMDLEDELMKMRDLRMAPEEETAEVKQMLRNEKMRKRLKEARRAELGEEEVETKPARGRGSRGGRARGRGRGSTVVDKDEMMIDETPPSPPRPTRGVGSRGGRVRAATRTTARGRAAGNLTQTTLNITRSPAATRTTQRTNAGNRMQFLDDSD